MVELKGIEPLTPALQTRCSSQLSYSPNVFRNDDNEHSTHSDLPSVARLVHRSLGEGGRTKEGATAPNQQYYTIIITLLHKTKYLFY